MAVPVLHCYNYELQLGQTYLKDIFKKYGEFLLQNVAKNEFFVTEKEKKVISVMEQLGLKKNDLILVRCVAPHERRFQVVQLVNLSVEKIADDLNSCFPEWEDELEETVYRVNHLIVRTTFFSSRSIPINFDRYYVFNSAAISSSEPER